MSHDALTYTKSFLKLQGTMHVCMHSEILKFIQSTPRAKKGLPSRFQLCFSGIEYQCFRSVIFLNSRKWIASNVKSLVRVARHSDLHQKFPQTLRMHFRVHNVFLKFIRSILRAKKGLPSRCQKSFFDAIYRMPAISKYDFLKFEKNDFS